MASVNSRFEMLVKSTLNGFLQQGLRSSAVEIILKVCEYILKELVF